jgi:hypothetical protein
MSAIKDLAGTIAALWLFATLALPLVALVLDHVFDEEKAANLVFKLAIIAALGGAAALLGAFVILGVRSLSR